MSKEAIISSYAAQNLFEQYLASLKLVLELELKRKAAIKEESREMDDEAWSRLPHELLMLILGKLQTLVVRKFRVVCKEWNVLLSPPAILFKGISSAVTPCNSSPGFLIGGLSFSRMKNSVLKDLYLIHSAPTSSMQRLSTDFLGALNGSVVTSCKSILCFSCNNKGDPEAPSLFYICNPVTRTWQMLPPLVGLRSGQDFSGLAFDPFTRRFIFITGENRAHQNQNSVVMEMYDSEIESWTKLEMKAAISLCPTGEGVYSRGRFYWINQTLVGSMLRNDVAAFDVADKSWGFINQPENFCHGKLTGYDGNVILVDHKDLSLWKLNEDVKEKEDCWLDFKVFSRNLCTELALNQGNSVDFRRQRNPEVNVGYSDSDSHSHSHSQVVVNSCGWILVHLYTKRLVVADEEGRVMRSIEGKLLNVFEQAASPLPLHAYEINNVWWP